MPNAPRFRLLLPTLLALVANAWPHAAGAQVRRCASPTGELIYTDRECRSIGATDRLLRVPPVHAGSAYRGGCSRQLSDLVYGLTAAIGAGDVNRLALYYDWTGMSTRQAYAVMGRLEGVAQRPLVDVLPVYPSPPPILSEDGSVLDANTDGYYPQTVRRGAPVALRVEQTFGDQYTPSRTIFGLRRRMGCWWVRL